MLVLDLPVVALDLLICFFLQFRHVLYFYVVVGELVWDVVALELPGLLEMRVLSNFWWIWWFLIYLSGGS